MPDVEHGPDCYRHRDGRWDCMCEHSPYHRCAECGNPIHPYRQGLMRDYSTTPPKTYHHDCNPGLYARLAEAGRHRREEERAEAARRWNSGRLGPMPQGGAL